MLTVNLIGRITSLHKAFLVLFTLAAAVTVYCLYDFGSKQFPPSPFHSGFALSALSLSRLVARDNVTPTSPTSTTTTEHRGPEWEPRKLILFSYHRSGSSLTGDIINHSDDVYYIYEPLRAMAAQRFLKNETEIRTANAYLSQILSCDFTSPLLDKVPRSFLRLSNATWSIDRCLHLKVHEEELEANRTPDENSYAHCIQQAQTECKSHKLTAVKVVRYNMRAARQMMTFHHDLGVIYLLRDPRASIWSRLSVMNQVGSMQRTTYFKELCQEMLEHLLTAQDVFRVFPKRFRFLRYEDLADDPVLVSQKMYQFLQLNFTESIKTKVTQQTNSTSGSTTDKSSDFSHREGMMHFHGQNLADVFNVVRSESSTAARMWRNAITWVVVRDIQTSEPCSQLMFMLGYQTFNSLQDVRDWTVPSRVKASLQQTLFNLAADHSS